MKKLFFLILTMVSATAFAQTDSLSIFQKLAQPNEGEGTITIQQDPRVETLVKTHVAINRANGGKVSGWRVQIYSSSSTNSRTEAQNVRKIFLAKYPEVGTYLIYQPPFFKIRVGDFRTKEEAYSFYKQLLTDFPVSYLITDLINYPPLIEAQSTPAQSDLDKLLESVH